MQRLTLLHFQFVCICSELKSVPSLKKMRTNSHRYAQFFDVHVVNLFRLPKTKIRVQN